MLTLTETVFKLENSVNIILFKIEHTYQQIVTAIHRSGFITHPKPQFSGSNNINSQSFII